MKKLILPFAAACAAVALPTAAPAAPFLMLAGAGGSYGNDSLTCTGGATSCTFTDTYTFATPAGFNLASLTLSSSEVGADATTDVSFSTVTLNGANFSPIVTGYTEFYNLLNQTIVAGATNTLSISGTTGGHGSYGGSLSFATSAVPEPAMWSLMVMGFGLVGYGQRRRQALRAVKAA